MRTLFPINIEQLRLDKQYLASPQERINLIVENLANEFESILGSGIYHCSFKFQEEDSKATSHFILHFTKHPKGYELIKQICYDFDNIGAALEKKGVYTFDSKNWDESRLNFNDINVKALAEQLESAYKGQTIVAEHLFNQHHVSTKFCRSHYAKTLRYMFEKGKVIAKFTDDKDHRVSILVNENCILTFA